MAEPAYSHVQTGEYSEAFTIMDPDSGFYGERAYRKPTGVLSGLELAIPGITAAGKTTSADEAALAASFVAPEEPLTARLERRLERAEERGARQAGRQAKELTPEERMGMAAAIGTAGEGIGSAIATGAQLGLSLKSTPATRYAEARIEELGAQMAKGFPLSPEEMIEFDSLVAQLDAQAAASRRREQAYRTVSGDRSARAMRDPIREERREQRATRVGAASALASARVESAAQKLKEYESLLAWDHAQRMQRREYLSQTIGALGPILGQIAEARGVKVPDTKEAKMMLSLLRKYPGMAKILLPALAAEAAEAEAETEAKTESVTP
jgi:hypothetical protein